LEQVDENVLEIIGKPNAEQCVGFGTVKFYANEPNKQFGFISSEHGDIYIHGSRCYRLADVGKDLPRLGEPERIAEGSLLDPPKRKNSVLFVAESDNRGGLRAVRWVKWSDAILQAVLDEICDRPKYQLVERKGPAGQLQFGSMSVLWEGTDLEQVRRRFPKRRIVLHDTDEGALYFTTFQDDEWIPCGDPR